VNIAISKLTSKGQATIPSRVRKKLNLGPGDQIAFHLHEDRVDISRAEPIDLAFIKAQESNLRDEWLSAEDEAAYGKL
jgi:AbrB family looped-hinge helix DNA binding protein